MAGKVILQKSKAKLNDAIALNGEALEYLETNSEMNPDENENENPESADEVQNEAGSTEDTPNIQKGTKRKASESLDEIEDSHAVVSSENDKQELEAESKGDASFDSQTRRSGRKIRPKKPKTAYDDSPAAVADLESTKEESTDDVNDVDANTKEVSGGRTPSQTSLKSDDSKSGRKIRSKKLKIAYDDSAAPNADQATIKREQMDGVVDANTKEDNPRRRPSSQMSFKSDETNRASPALEKRTKVDLTSPLLRVPMSLGWKRELVYRSKLDHKSKRMGDVYYHSPSGKVLRSIREVAGYLTEGLTIENFTFCKEPLGLNDPNKEVVRDAKITKRLSSSSRPNSPLAVSTSSNSSALGKRTPKPKLPKGASPPPSEDNTIATTSKTPIKVSPKKSPQKPAFKVKLTNARLSDQTKLKHSKILKRRSMPTNVKNPEPDIKVEKQEKTNNTEKTGKPDKSDNPDKTVKSEKLGKLGKSEATKKTIVKKSTIRKLINAYTDTIRNSTDVSLESKRIEVIESKPEVMNFNKEQCSIQCLQAMGMIPTLQCQQCLCLYHYECIGINREDHLADFKCLKCCGRALGSNENIIDTNQSGNKTTLPPLTPISSLKSHHPNSDSPPKLLRIPRSGDKSYSPKLIVDKINKPFKTSDKNKKNVEDPTQVNNTKSLLGSVTTWLPPSSSIQMSKSQAVVETSATTSAQGIVQCGGKKYIVVPKYNVLNVFPAQTADDTGMKITDKALSGLSITTISASNLNSDKTKDPKLVNPSESLYSYPDSHVPSKLQNSIRSNSLPESDLNLVDNIGNGTKRKRVHETGSSVEHEAVENNDEAIVNSTESPERQIISTHAPFVQHFCLNVSAGYFALLKIFQYLKVQELLRASRVCRFWNEMSNSPSLWRTVRMKNSQVGDWHGFAKSLQKHHTKILDLRKMLIPASVNPDDMWKQFSKNIGLADSLISIDFCRCPAGIIEKLCETNPKMEIINAVTIRDDKLDLMPFASLKNLHELRLKSSGGFEIKNDLSPLKELKNLKHLSITSVKELGKCGCEVIADLVELQSLELGECSDFPEDFGSNVLSKLQKLERLRLEKGQGNCHTFSILECVSQLPVISQLELVNFDIKAGFDKSLALCTNIRRMLIIPTYITQSATTNHMVLRGVIKLSSSLTHFVWGVTLELLRVTELFVDQYENNKIKDKKPLGESIPVLKPVPSLSHQNEDKSEDEEYAAEAPQVEILTLQALQKLLNGSLPQTRVRILKIPFHASWRQSISDSQ